MEFGDFSRDPLSDLELNLQCLSNDLCSLVDNNSQNDLDSIFDPELSNITFDGHFKQISPNCRTDSFSDRSTEDSGFLSAHNNSTSISEYFDLESKFIPKTYHQKEIPMPNASPPKVGPVPSLVPTWHPSYGNILMQLIPQTSPYFGQFSPTVSVMQHPLVISCLPAYSVGVNPEEYFNTNYFGNQKSHGYMRPNRNFNKKYPRRSQKGFNVLPNYKKDESETLLESVDKIVIDLREINIGPSSLYESNQTKLMNKFLDTLKFLSNLANECVETEFYVLDTALTEEQITTKVDFTQDVRGYQFSHYLRCIITHSKLEQMNAKMIFQGLNLHFVEKIGGKFDIWKLGNDLIQEMHEKTTFLTKLCSLNINRDIVLDVNEQPAELELINEALNDFIKAVRNVTVCLWSLKFLFKTGNIYQFSQNNFNN